MGDGRRFRRPGQPAMRSAGKPEPYPASLAASPSSRMSWWRRAGSPAPGKPAARRPRTGRLRRRRGADQPLDLRSPRRRHQGPVGLVAEDLAERRRGVPLPHDLEAAGIDQRRMTRSARPPQGEQLGPQADDVFGGARRLELRVEAPHQPAVLGRDAGRALVGVAALGLDAADGQHGLAADVDHVAAQRERGQSRVGEAQPAGADEDHVLRDPRPREDGIDA